MRKRNFQPALPPFPGAGADDADAGACEAPGCVLAGSFPAPRSREHPRPYRRFCLEHVRAYNANWDYYAGMSADQIDADRRLDVTWRRPTWTFGDKTPSFTTSPAGFDDPLGVFGAAPTGGAHAHVSRFPPGSDEARAVQTMDLDDDFDLDALKLRYKTLVKLWHPDANGGSRAAEDRLKTVNEAYKVLKDALVGSLPLPDINP